jgi:hypothetical protein
MGDSSHDDLSGELVSTARAVTGDELRSLTYFTEDEFEQLYLRDDLERDADLVGFAENERLGFRSQAAYAASELGDYRFTIRVFSDGYLTRIISGDHGLWVTTDTMHVDRFEELAQALSAVLDDL